MRRTTYILILTAFLANTFGPIPTAQAQELRLPAPGVMVGLSPDFNPPVLKGIKVHLDDPFRFDFILDQGDSYRYQENQQETTRLIKYFLSSLTIPEKDLWVNLSPYEKDHIIPGSFGQTEMGRDLLAEDYMLKQITASLIYPEGETGKKFWKRIYEEAAKKYSTTNIPVNTFNKVWIVPGKAVVYENAGAGTAYVVDSKLKVMLEQDYLSLSKHRASLSTPLNFSNLIAANIVREIVIPELTKEVNEDKNFAQLRQVYNSLILATWYKKKIKDSILEQVYANKNKVAGVGFKSSINIETIYQRYLQAFKKGVFNYIKEEPDAMSQETVPRKYFSGGFDAAQIAPMIDYAQASQLPSGLARADIVTVNFTMAGTFGERKGMENNRARAVQVSDAELLRDSKSDIQLNYRLNHQSVRKLAVDFILTAVSNQEKLNIARYKKFLEDVHTIELVGEDGKTIYLPGDMLEFAIRHGYIHEGDAATREVFNRIIENITFSPMEIHPAFSNQSFDSPAPIEKSLEKFNEYLALPDGAGIDEVVRVIAEYYRSSAYPFAFPGAGNNSLFMNVVNAMLILKGFHGISHGLLDYDVWDLADGRKSNFFINFGKAFMNANPGHVLTDDFSTLDRAMAGDEERFSTSSRGGMTSDTSTINPRWTFGVIDWNDPESVEGLLRSLHPAESVLWNSRGRGSDSVRINVGMYGFKMRFELTPTRGEHKAFRPGHMIAILYQDQIVGRFRLSVPGYSPAAYQLQGSFTWNAPRHVLPQDISFALMDSGTGSLVFPAPITKTFYPIKKAQRLDSFLDRIGGDQAYQDEFIRINNLSRAENMIKAGTMLTIPDRRWVEFTLQVDNKVIGEFENFIYGTQQRVSNLDIETIRSDGRSRWSIKKISGFLPVSNGQEARLKKVMGLLYSSLVEKVPMFSAEAVARLKASGDMGDSAQLVTEQDFSRFEGNLRARSNEDTEVKKAVDIVHSYPKIVYEVGGGNGAVALAIAMKHRGIGVISTDSYDTTYPQDPTPEDLKYYNYALSWQKHQFDAQKANLENLAILRSSMEDLLQLPDNSLDYILLVNPMDDNLSGVFVDAIWRKLKVGGQIVIKPLVSLFLYKLAHEVLQDLPFEKLGTEFLGVNINSTADFEKDSTEKNVYALTKIDQHMTTFPDQAMKAVEEREIPLPKRLLIPRGGLSEEKLKSLEYVSGKIGDNIMHGRLGVIVAQQGWNDTQENAFINNMARNLLRINPVTKWTVTKSTLVEELSKNKYSMEKLGEEGVSVRELASAGEYFDWLMEKGYFEEKSGTEGRPNRLDSEKIKLLSQTYRKQIVKIIMSVLKQVDGYVDYQMERFAATYLDLKKETVIDLKSFLRSKSPFLILMNANEIRRYLKDQLLIDDGVLEDSVTNSAFTAASRPGSFLDALPVFEKLGNSGNGNDRMKNQTNEVKDAYLIALYKVIRQGSNAIDRFSKVISLFGDYGVSWEKLDTPLLRREFLVAAYTVALQNGAEFKNLKINLDVLRAQGRSSINWLPLVWRMALVGNIFDLENKISEAPPDSSGSFQNYVNEQKDFFDLIIFDKKDQAMTAAPALMPKASAVLDQVQGPYQQRDRTFNLDGIINKEQLEGIVFDEARKFARESELPFKIFDPDKIIIQIAGSSSYLTDPEGKVYWPGVDDLDIFVFVPNAIRKGELYQEPIRLRIAKRLKEDLSKSLHISILAKEGLLDPAVNKDFPTPYRPENIYLGTQDEIARIESAAQGPQYKILVLKEYAQIYENYTNEKSYNKRLKDLFRLAKMRGDRTAANKLFAFIKDAYSGGSTSEDLTDLAVEAKPDWDSAQVAPVQAMTFHQELDISAGVYPDAVVDPLASDRTAPAVLVDIPQNRHLVLHNWMINGNEPFSAQEKALLAKSDPRELDQFLSMPDRPPLSSIRFGHSDRSSGFFVVPVALTFGDKTFYRTYRGVDSGEVLKQLTQFLPSLEKLKGRNDGLQVSAGNQRDLIGNFNIIPARDRKGWDFYGSVDEPWQGETYRSIVQFTNGERKLGLIRMQGDEHNKIHKVFLKPGVSENSPSQEIELQPNEVDFILFANTIGWEGTEVKQLLQEEYHHSSDLRHLFRFPFLNGSIFYDQLAGDAGKLKDAFDGKTVKFTLTHQGKNLTKEQYERLFAFNGYSPMKSIQDVDATSTEADKGGYYVQEAEHQGEAASIYVKLLRAKYPINSMVAGENGELAFVSVQGISGQKGANYWTYFEWVKKEVEQKFGWTPKAVFVLDNGKHPQVNQFLPDGQVKMLVKQGGSLNYTASISVLNEAMTSDQAMAVPVSTQLVATLDQKLLGRQYLNEEVLRRIEGSFINLIRPVDQALGKNTLGGQVTGIKLHVGYFLKRRIFNIEGRLEVDQNQSTRIRIQIDTRTNEITAFILGDSLVGDDLADFRKQYGKQLWAAWLIWGNEFLGKDLQEAKTVRNPERPNGWRFFKSLNQAWAVQGKDSSEEGLINDKFFIGINLHDLDWQKIRTSIYEPSNPNSAMSSILAGNQVMEESIERVREFFNHRELRPDIKDIYRMVKENALTEKDILAAAQQINYPLPRMRGVYFELENAAPYLKKIAQRVLDEYAGDHIFIAARDGEILYDAIALLAQEKGIKVDLRLFQYNDDLESALSRDTDAQRRKYLNMYGIDEGSLKDGKRFIFMDTGFAGSQLFSLRDLIKKVYPNLLGWEDRWDYKLISYRYDFRHELMNDNYMDFTTGNENWQEMFPRHSLWLRGYMPHGMFTDTEWEMDHGNPWKIKRRQFNLTLATVIQTMPHFHAKVTSISDDGGYLIKEPSRRFDNVDNFGDYNADIINPVAALLVEYQLAKFFISHRVTSDRAMKTDQAMVIQERLAGLRKSLIGLSGGKELIVESVGPYKGSPPAGVIDPKIVNAIQNGQFLEVYFKNIKENPNPVAALINASYGLSVLLQNAVDETNPEWAGKNFDLMMTELLKNAVYHGNSLRMDLPVFIRINKKGVDVVDLGLGDPQEPWPGSNSSSDDIIISGGNQGLGHVNKYGWVYDIQPLMAESTSLDGIFDNAHRDEFKTAKEYQRFEMELAEYGQRQLGTVVRIKIKNVTRSADQAMNGQKLEKGGIDLTPANLNLQTQNNNGVIKFHLDPAMLKQLQNAPGFVPIIVNVQPLRDLRSFLGVIVNQTQ